MRICLEDQLYGVSEHRRQSVTFGHFLSAEINGLLYALRSVRHAASLRPSIHSPCRLEQGGGESENFQNTPNSQVAQSE